MPQPPPFQAFIDEHARPVLSYLRATVGPVDADDCFQETFLSALRAYSRLDGANPRAWVLTIARRKAIDHHRARTRRPEPRAELPEAVAAGGKEAGRGVGGAGSWQEGLWRQVATLPPKQRHAVALRFAADLSYRDVGVALDCSEDAARRNVHEGLKKLRASIALESEEER
jgi:RNA polymerase sigma factor (sigma-70 family)